MVRLALAPGVCLWREKFSPVAQKALMDEVFALLEEAPLYRPVMPLTGKPFSVEESNFGRLGWVSDRGGYRYQPLHPVTAKPWPAIPSALLELWNEIAEANFDDPLRPSLARVPATATSPLGALRAQGEGPDCCLLNLYRKGAKMGLHQDRDEKDLSAPVVGVSLGDDALFRIGGVARGGATQSVKLGSGDVILFGGPARLAYHGIDRVVAGSSRLVPGGGRLSLTLRKVGL
jgi:alkylated DNA repair protein (DNA oxidative demethylase)